MHLATDYTDLTAELKHGLLVIRKADRKPRAQIPQLPQICFYVVLLTGETFRFRDCPLGTQSHANPIGLSRRREVTTFCHRIARHSPFKFEWMANRNRTDCKALMSDFSAKFSGDLLLSATYGYVVAYRGKTVPRVRIPLSPPRSLSCREIELHYGKNR